MRTYEVIDDNGLLKTSYMDSEAFREAGLLWFINRSLFHPLGYALAIDTTTNQFQLWGNGDEPWTFELPEGEENRMFSNVQQLFTDLLKFTPPAPNHPKPADSEPVDDS